MNKRTQKSNAKSSTFFGGAAILAASIAVVKVIGALYKIPLGRILGDVGFGHFNNAYAIYNLLLMVSTAGLPVAMSKTISEANALNRRNQVSRVFHVALVTFIILGSISSLIMFLFAQPLANLQGDSLAAPAVRVMALSCFFVCTMSAYRGYAQGHSDMVPTAVSQVLEAMTKLIVGLFLAWYLLRLGFGSEFSAAGAIAGVTASGLVSLVYLMIRFRRKNSAQGLAKTDDRPESAKHILKVLASIAIPITLSSSVVPITTYLDTVQVQNLLQSALGYSEELAVSLYGCYQKAITIYNLPSAFMVSLTACIVPAVSAALTKKDKIGAGKIAESALRVGALLALPAGVGLAVLSGPIIQMLYPETNQEIASHCQMVLGIASAFVCMMLLCNAILQANGRAALPLVHRYRQRHEAHRELHPGADALCGHQGCAGGHAGVLYAGLRDGAHRHQARHAPPPQVPPGVCQARPCCGHHGRGGPRRLRHPGRAPGQHHERGRGHRGRCHCLCHPGAGAAHRLQG